MDKEKIKKSIPEEQVEELLNVFYQFTFSEGVDMLISDFVSKNKSEKLEQELLVNFAKEWLKKWVTEEVVSEYIYGIYTLEKLEEKIREGQLKNKHVKKSDFGVFYRNASTE